jgi:ATP-dependent RNA helicase DHX37/DHR1
MPEFAQPEIFRSPLEGVVLQLKSMNIGRVDNFPFPTPPERGVIIKAERLLKNLGALDTKGRITKLGRDLQRYPLNPRFAQMLRLGVVHGCARETIAIVAALDVPEIIVPENQLDLQTPSKDEDEEKEKPRIWTVEDDAADSLREARRKAYTTAQAKFSRLDFDKRKITPQADALKLLAAITDYSSIDDADKGSFCKENFLREKGLREASQLREQLSAIVRHVNNTALAGLYAPKLSKPNEKTTALLKQIVASGFIDQIAIRADLLPSPPIQERKPKRAIDVKYKALFSTWDPASTGAREEEEDGFVYIHPSSLLSRLPPASTPRYIVYQRLQRSQPSRPGARSRIRMHPLTPVSAEQVAALARGTGLLEIGKPVGKVDVLPTGEDGHERRECDVMLSLIGDGGGIGWPLVRRRVVQKRIPGEGWAIERWND